MRNAGELNSVIDEYIASSTGPLAGFVVADFGRVLAAPYSTMLLGDLGATIIKIEAPSGDETRWWQPPVYQGESTYYLSINRNKFNIQLDLRDPADLATARAILARADVMVDNFKPGGLEKLGLGHDDVRREFPHLIVASVTGFGETGGKDLPGYDLLVQAASGHMHITGDVDTEPYRAGIAMFDVMTGLHLTIGIVSALLDRERHGNGQRISTNLMATALSCMANQTGAAALTGASPMRMGNEHPSIYPYAPFETSDGRIVLAVGNDRQYVLLCDLLERPDLATDRRFAAAKDRSNNRAQLEPLLTEILQQRTTQEWFDLLSPAGIPCGPINDVLGGLKFAESLGLDPVTQVGEGERRFATVRNPVNYSEYDLQYRLAPPQLDEHRDAILAWAGQSSATQEAPVPSGANA
ncbi:CoA transferase [Gulosibacter molinativorax]|uniref:CoA transferase n=2 Tax=Gulosibacter molinativorax TaxID=256821 RepID=A0ABT7C878_9MICO|nr:CoA transferase [Gulosibacter molinativorax]